MNLLHLASLFLSLVSFVSGFHLRHEISLLSFSPVAHCPIPVKWQDRKSGVLVSNTRGALVDVRALLAWKSLLKTQSTSLSQYHSPGTQDARICPSTDSWGEPQNTDPLKRPKFSRSQNLFVLSLEKPPTNLKETQEIRPLKYRLFGPCRWISLSPELIVNV